MHILPDNWVLAWFFEFPLVHSFGSQGTAHPRLSPEESNLAAAIQLTVLASGAGVRMLTFCLNVVRDSPCSSGKFNLPIGMLHFQFMGNGIYGKTVFQDQLPTPLAQLPEVMKECYHCLQALWNFTQPVTFSRVFQVSMRLLRKCFWSEQCETCYKDQKTPKNPQLYIYMAEL